MGSVTTWGVVALGGAIGTLARFWMAAWMMRLTGPEYPWGTLAINIIGSFVIGATATLAAERVMISADLRIFIMVGLCGGFTTFSSFSLQTLDLLRGGQVPAAILYAMGSVGLCLLGTWGGVALARL
jgi:CrcB protein